MKRCMSCLSLSQLLWYVLICACWSFGVIAGIFCFASGQTDCVLLGTRLPVTSPSILILVLLRFGLLLLTILLLRYCRCILPVLITSVSFSYGLLISCIQCSYGSAGWLVSFLILTPDTFLLICFVLYCISRSANPLHFVRRDVIISFTVICAVSLVECYYISPFVSNLF